jgi:DNA-binding CsgD family transcriptional regulator/tetratricopeptide (TPR) repeat protein
MNLPPLSRNELAELLAGVNGAPVKPALLRRIVARSAGNPYYAQELLAAGEDGRLPAGLTDLLLERLEQLSEPAKKLVRLASVLGSARIDDALLRSTVSDSSREPLSGDDLETALREAIAQQVLVPEELDRYRFRHALLQEAIYSDLLPGERVRLHRAVASRLEPLIGSPGLRGVAGEVARHSLAANDMPAALNASLQAAQVAACGNAPAEALQHYEQALQLWDVVPSEQRAEDVDRSTVSLLAAAAAGNAGLLERAVDLAAAATEEAEAEGDFAAVARARATLSQHTYVVDRPREAHEQAMQVIGDLSGDDSPSPARAMAWSMVARTQLGFGNPQEAIKAVVPALAESQALGMTALQVDLLTTQAVAEGMLGRDEESARSYRLARAAAEVADDTAGTVRVLYNIAINHLDRGDLNAGIADLQAAIEVADASGLPASVYAAQARQLLITTFWQIGDVENALSVVRPDTGSSRLPMALVTQLRLHELPVLAAREPDQVLRSDEWLVLGEEVWERQVLYVSRAEALSWLGQWQEAAVQAQHALDFVLSDAEPWPLAGIHIDARAVSALADGAEEARRRNDTETERTALAEIESFLEDGRTRGRLGLPRRGVMGPEGRAWQLRLELEAARARGTDEAAAWLELAEGFEGVSVYEVARARWRAATRLLREQRPAQAREQILLAYEKATRLGAQPLLRELQSLATAAGVTLPGPEVTTLGVAGAKTSVQGNVLLEPSGAGRPRNGRPRVKASGSRPVPEAEGSGTATSVEPALTPREREVMLLVADGLTNRAIGERLFISEKTASVHISNVLAKFGASGRTEAVAIMSRLGLIT